MPEHGIEKPQEIGGGSPLGAANGVVITEAEVTAIAHLANLDLTAEETGRMTRELGRILAYVQQLAEVDVSAVEPAEEPRLAPRRSAGIDRTSAVSGLRQDVPVPGLDHDRALDQAPRVAEGGFAVPTFVDEG